MNEWGYWLFGFVMGVAVAALAMFLLAMYAKGKAAEVGKVARKLVPVVAVALVVAVLLAPQMVTLAQTAVPIVIDTNEIFEQTNNWIAQFTPIQAIGIGASIALAILSFLGATLVAAFRNR